MTGDPKTPLAERRYRRRWRQALIALAGAVVIAGAILAYWLTRPPAPPPELKERRLTFNPSENAVNAARNFAGWEVPGL